MEFDPYWEWLQIPPDRRPADFYALLGLPPFESDPESIRLAGIQRTSQVRKFCLGPHGPDATRLLGELAQAFSCLADPPRKQNYDDSLGTPKVPAAGALGGQRRNLGEDAPPPLHSLPPPVGDCTAGETDGDLQNGRFEREALFSPARPATRSVAALWTSRKHYRKRASDRKLVLLLAGCALLASTIAVLARQKLASLVPTGSPASVQAAIAEQKADEASAPAVEETPLPPESLARDMQSEERSQPQPSGPAAEKPAPEPNLAPRPPQEIAQFDPPAASHQNRAPATVLPQSPASDSASGAGPDAEADAQRREQEEEQQAQELLKLGLDASSSGKLDDALGYFIDAIEKARYRNAPVTTEAARELDNAWRSLNVRRQKGKLAREARKVWLDFHNRLLEHPPSQPASTR